MTHKEKVLTLLADGEPHSHHELYALHVIAHSRVADLRRDGHHIDQWRDGDTYMYRLSLREDAEPCATDLPATGLHSPASSLSEPVSNPDDDEKTTMRTGDGVGTLSLFVLDEVAA